MKLKRDIILGLMAMAILPSNLHAVIYVVGGSNVSDAVSDQVVVDNTGALTSGGATASLGYFNSIADPSSASRSALAADFVALATSDFGETDPTVNGLFDMTTNIDTDVGTTYSDAVGNDLYLFIGNKATLGASDYIGLVDIGQQLSGIVGPGPFQTKINYSAGNFGVGGTIILGQTTMNNVNFITGNTTSFSTGTFELTQVPEPSSTALLGLGGVAFLLRRRR